MKTEQKIFNDLIETIVNNSENNEAKITNVELWAKSWKEEMNQALTLTNVVGQSEQLVCLECKSTDCKTAIHTDYNECNKCYHYWEAN